MSASTEPLVEGRVDLTVLPNTANGEAQAGVEIAVLDQHIGAVGLQRNTVVAVVYDPVAEGDVVHVDSVRSVSLRGLLALHSRDLQLVKGFLR